ncbi:DUF6932 family protein [Kitasatospora fiedleri]|uniref:DUF6932 family protein n=1 Tax=Kitasatospora fiedleri TaxID=2991545 RepID=UPI00384D1EB9
MEDLFVTRAPHSETRKRIFDAFALYFTLVQDLIGRGTLWVNGGFCTHKEEPPKDIDLVIIANPEDIQHFGQAEEERLVQLLTLQGVNVGMPQAFSPRVQPMGGLIDAFFILSEDFDAVKMWDTLWSSVKGADGNIIEGATKGYLEVSW